jgi:thiol-disulfide isomerase/thioredoxin
MSRSLKLVVPTIALACALLVAGCDKQTPETVQPDPNPSEMPKSEKLSGVIDRSHKGEGMPDMTIKDASGKSLALSTLRGKPTLVNLWATWCAPCVVELPTLDRLVDIREGKLKVLTVSQDLTGTDKVAAFIKERGGDNLEPWIDPKGDLGAKYQVQTLPTTILYNSQGQEVWRFMGGKIWTNVEALQLVNEAK